MMKTTMRIFCAIVIAAAPLTASESAYVVSQWEISQSEAVKTYFANTPYAAFDPCKTKDYKNRMFAQLIQINPELSGHTMALKSSGSPSRELLFIDSRLVLITDEYYTTDDNSFKKIISSLNDIYGVPQQTKEGVTTFYTYRNDSTTVILQAAGTGSYEVKIFMYGKSLFRSMFFKN